MSKLKVYHAELPNMGDLLNVLLVKEYFKLDMVRKSPLTATLSGIGSGLGQFTLTDDNIAIKTAKLISGKLFPVVHVWGTGFIENKEWGPFYRKNMKFHAIRGQLSKEKAEKIMGVQLNIKLGDGGILAPYLVEKGIENSKQYSVGIIPHFKEQKHPYFSELASHYKNSKIIDLRDEPHQVIEEIAKCEVIISSSLHGLIVADSFGIPNMHLVVTDNLLGDGFKFDDYYSAYGINHEFVNFNTLDDLNHLPKRIISKYKIPIDKVIQMQKDMEETFPFKVTEDTK